MEVYSRINTTVILAVVRNLCPLSPDDLTTSCHKTKLTDINFDNRTLRQDAQLRIHRALRVLLHTNNRQLDRHSEFWMRDVRLLVTETHGSNEPFVLHRSSRKVVAHKRRFRNHALPALLVCLLARVHHLEHLLLTDTLHLWQRHLELGSLLRSLVLNRTTQCLGIRSLRSIQKIVGQGGRRRFLWSGGFDILLFLRLDALAHLNLFGMAFLLVEFGTQAAEGLGFVGGSVGFTGGALAGAFLVVEAASLMLEWIYPSPLLE